MAFPPSMELRAPARLAMAAALLWLACSEVPQDGEEGLRSPGLESQALQVLGSRGWGLTGSMVERRRDHTATLLRDGKVLVVGGRGSSNSVAYDSAELYDPATGLWTTLGGRLNTARSHHTATLLQNGKVLVVGGADSAGARLSSAELYDPATGLWTLAGQLSTARDTHTATLLKSGEVLVAGGINNDSWLTSVELYDPVNNTWDSPSGIDLNRPRLLHTATLLPDGRVLVAGGRVPGSNPDDGQASTEIYDPSTRTWTLTAGMREGRFRHTATLLPNGKVLVAGGQYKINIIIDETCAARNTAEVYDPSNNSWNYVDSLQEPRSGHMAALLANGQVLIAGGVDWRFCDTVVSFHTEVYSQGAWTWVGDPSISRTRHTMTLLPNGKVLMTGGWGGGGVQSSAELYNPGEERWTGASSNALPRNHVHPSATLLPNGEVLVAGGQDTDGTALNDASTYEPNTGSLTSTLPLTQARSQHTATLLVSGKVLVAGGRDSTGAALDSAELYDPATREWTPLTASLNQGRSRHTATLLPGGTVLLAGGQDTQGALDSVEVYDPGMGQFTATGPMSRRRSLHTATPLPGGTVLVVGGQDDSGAALDSVEQYDPVTRQWTLLTTSLAEGRWLHTTTLLPGGRVLIVGGRDSDGALASAELYDPARGRWTEIGSLIEARYGHTTTWLPSGRVLVAGGYDSNNTPLQRAELYDPATRQWAHTANMAAAHSHHAATLLAHGKVFVIGGESDRRAELYEDISVCQGCRPVLNPIPGPQLPEALLTLTGSSLSGLSEASNGTTQSSAANVSQVSLRAVEGGALIPLEPQVPYSDTRLTVRMPLVPEGYYILSVTAHAASGAAIVLVDGPPLAAPELTEPVNNSFVNTTRPAIKGRTAPGRRVTVWLNGRVAGTTLADPSGNWVFKPATELSQGPYVVIATAADAVGNVSPPTPPVSFRVDTLAPAPPVVSAPGAFVNTHWPTIAGTAEPGSTVTVRLNGTQEETTMATEAGTWSLTPATELVEGLQLAAVTAMDAAGNISAPASPLLSFTVDTLAPEPPKVRAPGAYVNTQRPIIAGTAEAGSNVAVWLAGAVIGTATASASGGWALTPASALADGPHEVIATATDVVGNASPPSEAHPFMVDTQAPALPSLSAPGRFVNTRKPIIAGTAEARSSVTVLLNGTAVGTVIANTSGDWALIPATELEEGPQGATATATDEAGNASAAPAARGFTVDVTAPPPPQVSKPGAFVNTRRPLMAGTAEAHSTVTIGLDGAVLGATPADENGNWRFTPTEDLAEGAHLLTVTATDAAGNVGAPPEARSLTVDILPPAPPAVSGPGASVNIQEPVIHGTAEPGSTVTVWLGGLVVGTPSADPEGNWGYLTQELTERLHEVIVTATDAAGNISHPTLASFEVDLTPPPQPVVTGPAAFVNVLDPVIRGTAERGSTVTVWLDGLMVGTVTANQAKTWLYSPSEKLSPGSHQVTATATDAAGNVSDTSVAYSFMIDLEKPPQPEVNEPGASVNTPKPVIAGTAEPGSTVTVKEGGQEIGQATADEHGTWSLTPLIELEAGEHSVSATATDAAGNEGPSSEAHSFFVRQSHYGWGCSSSSAFPATWALLALAWCLGRRWRSSSHGSSGNRTRRLGAWPAPVRGAGLHQVPGVRSIGARLRAGAL